MKNLTDKYKNMIQSFEADLSLALDGEYRLGQLDSLISAKDDHLLKDIELMEELSWKIRNNKVRIIEGDFH